MVTDEELYGQYLCGDETGLELLIKKYGDPLTLYIDGYLHDVHEAEDLMMETFSWLFTKKPRIRDGYMFEFACGVSGYILGVNPFNQPGVESYKKHMFALLGKPGFEDLTAQLLKRL